MDEDENLDFSSNKNWEANDIETCDESFKRFLSGWEIQRRMEALQLVCYLVEFIYIMELHYCSNYVDKKIMNNSRESLNV